MNDTATKCPRCGKGIPNDEREGEYPGALSRYDNQTEICSRCGADEAWFNFTHPGEELPPLTRPVFETEFDNPFWSPAEPPC